MRQQKGGHEAEVCHAEWSKSNERVIWRKYDFCILQHLVVRLVCSCVRLTEMKLRSRAMRTLVSMLVRFFRRRPGNPSKPSRGEDSELGLGSMLSIAIVSVTKTHTQHMNRKECQHETSIRKLTKTTHLHRSAISPARVWACTCSWSWGWEPRNVKWWSDWSHCRTVYPWPYRRPPAWRHRAELPFACN